MRSLLQRLLSSFRPQRRVEPKAALAEPADAAPVPAFIKLVAPQAAGREYMEREHSNAPQHQDRDPGRALGRVRQRAARSGDRRSAGARAAADAEESLFGGLGALAEISSQIFIHGTASLEHRNGAEHDAFFDPVTGRVIKLTQPGEFGSWGGLPEYLQRLAWANEFFEDDLLVEGWLRYPNEPAPRLVTSQPWYRVNPQRPEPILAEIDQYMARMGWLKAYDGAWIHRDREIVISDALPKNFVVDVAGYIQPIDLIIITPDDEQWDRLQNMARNLPQPSFSTKP